MKIFSIFTKDLKVVSRHKGYFMILFVCPILLIFIAGAVLNSNEYKNVRVGIINLDKSFEFNHGGVVKVEEYERLSRCLADLSAGKVTVCMLVSEEDGLREIRIYIDNTIMSVELYAKQFVLETVLKEQSNIFEETSGDIETKLRFYSTSIDKERINLVNVSKELDFQETLLKEFKENLSISKKEVDDLYASLNNSIQGLIELRNNLIGLEGKLGYDIIEIRKNVQEINDSMGYFERDLRLVLTIDEFNKISPYLQNIKSTTSQLDLLLDDLTVVHAGLPAIIELLNKVESILAQTEQMQIMLDRLYSDLDVFIEKNNESQSRTRGFIEQLDEVQVDIDQFSGKLSTANSVVSFFKAYKIDETPSFLLFPLLVSLIIMFTSLILSNMFILKEVNDLSYFRDLITPTSDIIFLISNYMTNLFFISIQAVVLFIIGVKVVGISTDSAFIFMLAVFLASSIFIFIGMSIGYLIKNQNMSMLISIFFLILLLILSDIFAPSMLGGEIVRFFTDLNPFVILTTILSDVIIFNKSYISIIPEFIKLFMFLFGSMILCYISRKYSREKMVV